MVRFLKFLFKTNLIKMKNIIFFINVKLLVSLIFFSYLSCGINEDTYTEVNTNLIGKGELSGAGDEGIPQQNIVISDSASWNNLKNQMDSVNNVSSTFTETDIDFSNFLILASFDQVRTTGGYSIDIKYVMENSCCVTAKVENVIPTGGVTAVITQPFHIVKIPKTNKQILFN